MDLPGRDPGQPLDWGGLVAWHVDRRGSLAAFAEALAEHRQHVDSVETIERALRRLRARGTQPGGVWGRRVLRAFRLPTQVEDRLRWFGHYHSRFTDLPTDVCEQLVRPWDSAPTSESPLRAWVQLALCSIALRRQHLPTAEEHLRRAEQTATGAAGVEALLVRAFLTSRVDPTRAAAVLARAREALVALPDDDDAACLHARLVDHLGYERNRAHEPAAAEALYRRIPEDGPPFAVVRRHNGLGWSALNQGRRDDAAFHGRLSVEAAGDGGYLRLRVMALRLLAAATTGPESAAAVDRAEAIAHRLRDATLLERVRRLRTSG